MVQTEEFNRKIANLYREQMTCRDIPQPRIILTFCAIPGSGKTTLAKRLAADLQTQYLHHDDIRNLLREHGIDPEAISVPPISRMIMRDIMAEDPNKFVLFDASIDHGWRTFFETIVESHAKAIIIRFDLPLNIIEDRLHNRDGENSLLLSDLSRFKSAFDTCREQVKADITLGADYDYDEVLKLVRSKIAKS